MIRRTARFIALGATLAAVGCQVAPSGETPAASTVPAPATSEGRRWLERGIVQFEQGRFADAIRTLQESPEIAADGPQVRAQALKVLAFAQCVTERRAACRRSFDALLALDPSFVLAPAESGHPMWGPEFVRAKAAAAASASASAQGASTAPRVRR